VGLAGEGATGDAGEEGKLFGGGLGGRVEGNWICVCVEVWVWRVGCEFGGGPTHGERGEGERERERERDKRAEVLD